MHSFCFGDSRNLVLKYEITGDTGIDWEITDFLETAGFEKKLKEDNIQTYIFPETADPLRSLKTIKSTVKWFAEILGPDALDVCEQLQTIISNSEDRNEEFQKAKQLGLEVKNKTEHNPEINPQTFVRELLPYQKKSVEHMLAMGNTANFSVPGSGKTTIAYAAISKWLDDGIVKKILVVGPKASFVPWEEEFEACFGRKPKSGKAFRVSGGKRAQDLPDLGPSYELFLIHYQTAMYHIFEIDQFLERNDTVLIIDESHNIKNPNLGRWATDAQKYGIRAKRRIILSGTPMPNDAKDLWTQLTFLWPFDYPLGNQVPYNDYVQRHGIGRFKPNIDPLFERITKADLGLRKPEFINHRIDLKPVQRKIYDVIAAKTLQEINDASIRDQARMQKFRMARMIRLLQTASNPSMLDEKSYKFDVDSEQFGFNQDWLDSSKEEAKISGISDTSFYDKVKNYSKYEIPSKLVAAEKIAQDLMKQGHKVIIWSSFKLNMYVFQDELFKDQNPILINGDISDNPDDPENRDQRISEFKLDTNPRVLIATAASLGESVSLHKHLGKKVCSDAIYLDRNFNGAQFMQSMDRIHRIGMDKDTVVNYHLIVAKKTIDEKIHERLWEKNMDMHHALNSRDLEPLDYDGNIIAPTSAEFDKDYNALVDHLRGKDDPELRDYNDD